MFIINCKKKKFLSLLLGLYTSTPTLNVSRHFFEQYEKLLLETNGPLFFINIISVSFNTIIYNNLTLRNKRNIYYVDILGGLFTMCKDCYHDMSNFFSVDLHRTYTAYDHLAALIHNIISFIAIVIMIRYLYNRLYLKYPMKDISFGQGFFIGYAICYTGSVIIDFRYYNVTDVETASSLNIFYTIWYCYLWDCFISKNYSVGLIAKCLKVMGCTSSKFMPLRILLKWTRYLDDFMISTHAEILAQCLTTPYLATALNLLGLVTWLLPLITIMYFALNIRDTYNWYKNHKNNY